MADAGADKRDPITILMLLISERNLITAPFVWLLIFVMKGGNSLRNGRRFFFIKRLNARHLLTLIRYVNTTYS